MQYASVSSPFGSDFTEGQSTRIALNFNNISSATFTYNYSFSSVGGTASGDDYTGSSGSGMMSISSFPPTTRTEDIPFRVNVDDLSEGTETLYLEVGLSGITFEDGSFFKRFELNIHDNEGPTGDVLVIGTLQQGETLSADITGVTDPDGIDASTAAYQWLRGGTPIAGATGATHVLTQDDVGEEIAVRYSFADVFGATGSVTSSATGTVENINDVPSGSVAISGTARQDETLAADATSVTDADGINASTIHYQWLRNGMPILDANGETYTLSSDDVGAQISVQFNFTDDYGVEETVTSALTASVEPPHLNLYGTTGDDVLRGREYNDTIVGLDGNDRLLGNAGNDSLDGGLGADTLNGGDGDDIIIGGPGSDDLRDVIFAGDGNDSVDAGAGNDQVFGQGGNDTIAGGFGVDEIQGQDGDDVITGSAFSDLVFGGAGDDFVNGGFGHDRINGGTGADKFFHVGVEGHGSDWVQDYNSAEGDVLLFGNTAATRADFQVNFAHTQNAEGERAGDDAVQEAFVIYRPTGQIMWALVDGEGQSSINLRIGSDVFDLLA